MSSDSRGTCGSPGRHPKCPFSDGGADLQVGLAVTADSVHCSTMVALLINLIRTLRSALHTRTELALEKHALRHQLANLRRTSGRPRPRRIHRAFWLPAS